MDNDSRKPYKLISFPKDTSGNILLPHREKPAGLDQYKPKYFTGSISLRLNVKTATAVASGLTVLKSDLLENPQGVPLVKPSVERNGRLIIPGSSLKGTVRSIYEAITRSCICKVTNNFRIDNRRISIKLPSADHEECKPEKRDIQTRQAKVCPACQIFGAMNWQGIVRFADAQCDQEGFEVEFAPSLYKPNLEREGYYSNFSSKVVGGRKFFYNFIGSVDQGEKGIDTQRAVVGYTFSTHLNFMNLTKEQLGALFISLGKNSSFNFALKVGAGKPIGMGSMTVDILDIELWSQDKNNLLNSTRNIRDRYLSYSLPESNSLTGDALNQFMDQAMQAAKNTQLVQQQQLQEIAEVLKYPTERTAPEGMY